MRWEYLVLEQNGIVWRTTSSGGVKLIDALTEKNPQEVLNIKGSEGWELVQVWERGDNLAYCEQTVFWFKRPIEDPSSNESKDRVLRALSEAIANGLAPGWELTKPHSED